MIEVNFEIIYAKNPNIHQDGYVEMPDDVEEDVEWFYYDQNGIAIPRQFTNHDEIGLTQIGATDEQKWEIDSFLTLINTEYVDWVNDVICTSDGNEQKTYTKGDLIIKINGGATFEVGVFNYCSDGEWDSEYYHGFRLYYNDELIKLNGDVYFEDPFTSEETKVSDILTLSHNMYVIELPKDYFDEDWDSTYRKYVIGEYKEAFASAYAKSLVADLGVYGIAYNIYAEELGRLNEGELDKLANNIEQGYEDLSVDDLFFMTEEDVEKDVRSYIEEGE
jgi:hypothetical protein